MKKTEIERLTEAALKAAKSSKVEYAIGGAVAMRAHGYSRETKDIDIFVTPSTYHKFLLALRNLDLQVVRFISGTHYAAFLPDTTDKDIRIDIVIPWSDPELGAVQCPDTKVIMGKKAKIFSMEFLVACKFISDRAKDHRDVLDLFDLGYFDPLKVEKLISSMDASEAARFRKFVKEAIETAPKGINTGKFPRKS